MTEKELKYEFTLNEVLALRRLLQHEFISYEDMEIIAVVRRIMHIEEENET